MVTLFFGDDTHQNTFFCNAFDTAEMLYLMTVTERQGFAHRHPQRAGNMTGIFAGNQMQFLQGISKKPVHGNSHSVFFRWMRVGPGKSIFKILPFFCWSLIPKHKFFWKVVRGRKLIFVSFYGQRRPLQEGQLRFLLSGGTDVFACGESAFAAAADENDYTAVWWQRENFRSVSEWQDKSPAPVCSGSAGPVPADSSWNGSILPGRFRWWTGQCIPGKLPPDALSKIRFFRCAWEGNPSIG